MWLFEISSSQVNLSSVSVLNNSIVYRDGRETFVTAPFMRFGTAAGNCAFKLCWYHYQLHHLLITIIISSPSSSSIVIIIIIIFYLVFFTPIQMALYFCYSSVVVFFIAELIIIHSGRVWMWKSNQNMIWLYLYNSLLKSLLGDGHIVTWFLIGWGPFYWHELTFISAWIIITCPVKCVMKLHIHSQTSTAVPLKFANA